MDRSASATEALYIQIAEFRQRRTLIAALYNPCIFMVHSVYNPFAEIGVLEGLGFFFFRSSLRKGRFHYMIAIGYFPMH